MSTSGYPEQIEALNARLAELHAQRRRLFFEWTKKHCPYKPGTVLEVPVGSDAHVGRKARVIRVAASEYDRGDSHPRWCWTFLGQVLKKDGQPANDGQAYAHFILPIDLP